MTANIPTISQWRSPMARLLEDAEVEHDVSARQAAFRIGVSQPAYTGWKGTVLPSIDKLPAISAFCRVPPGVILKALGLDVDRQYEFGDIPGYRGSGVVNLFTLPMSYPEPMPDFAA